jgi:hypothetical protein
MSVTVEWYNDEKTAFYVSYAPNWTWEQHQKAVSRIQHLREDYQLEQTYSIFNMCCTMIPIGSPVSAHFTEPQDGSVIVLIIDNTYTNRMMQIALRALRKHRLFHLVGTYEEARALIEAKLYPLEV